MNQPTQTNNATLSLAHAGGGSDLFGKTIRTVAVLVGSCVLFVGVLSLAAVLITSKAVSPSPAATDTQPATPSTAAAVAKKPVSI